MLFVLNKQITLGVLHKHFYTPHNTLLKKMYYENIRMIVIIQIYNMDIHVYFYTCSNIFYEIYDYIL